MQGFGFSRKIGLAKQEGEEGGEGRDGDPISTISPVRNQGQTITRIPDSLLEPSVEAAALDPFNFEVNSWYV